MDRFRPQIEQWMESDKTAPPKQRHTAQRMFERLRDEHGFTGGDGTVRRFVAKLTAQQPQEAFMPLVFEAGEEAQVDWGEAKVTITDTNKTSTLTVDDSSDTANRSGVFSSTSITGFGMGTAGAISYIGSQLASVSVHGGSGTNTDTITGTSAATSLYPGTNKSVVSTIAVRATTAPLTINGDGNADFITIGSLAPSLGGTPTAITGAITVTNTSNPSTLTLDDSGDTTHRTGTLTPTTITGLGMASGAKVTYTGSGLHLLTLRGNKGGAKLTETGTSCPVSLINITKV